MATESAIKKTEDVNRPERLRGGRTFVPYVDIVEQQDRLLLLADMPGVRAEDVNVDFERGLLTIHGRVDARQDAEQTTYLVREYGVGDFYRQFQIGEGIDANRIEAEMRNGVLTLHLPKSQEILPRKIAVKAG